MLYLTLALILSILLLIYSFLKKPNKLKHIPSPSLFECIKVQFENKARDKKIESLLNKRLHDNKVQTIWRDGTWNVALSSLEAAHKIYTDSSAFQRVVPVEADPNRLFSKFMGVNLGFSNYEVWRRYRMILNPPFKKQFDVSIFSTYTCQFFELVDNKYNGIKVDIGKHMQGIAMNSLGKGIMGVDFDSILNENCIFTTCYNQVARESANPFYFMFDFLDTPENPFRKSAYESLDKLDEEFKIMINNKKEQILNNDIKNSNDILMLMVKATLNPEIQFNEKEIRDNLMVFLLAGHDTTSFGLSVILHFLAQNPSVQHKLRQEIMNIMKLTKYNNGDSYDSVCPNIDQVKQMSYLEAVVKESLRLYPPVPELNLRKTSKDVIVDNYTIPKDTNVILSIYSINRDKQYWDEPEKFKPERFLNSNSHIDPLSWAVFGGGERLCIGMKFSLLEQKVVIAMILLRYKITYPNSTLQYHGPDLELKNVYLFTVKDLYLNFELL
ncbi:cytochrome P450 [Neoconidiobolus thromboides FSU 785]|nr:cytochrome P450 [Neoconidiobolus thromboides FSU 785]